MTAVLTIILLIIVLYMKKRKSHPKTQVICRATAMISALLLLAYMTTAFVAYTHGADLEALQKFSLKRTISAIKNSPVTDRGGSHDQAGNILIYYRFGCRDCEAVYGNLRNETAGKENIYWIASRQSEGQNLLQKYTVSEVPAGVIIQSENRYISYVLFNSGDDGLEESGDVRLDIGALGRLLELQKRELAKTQQ